MHALPACEALAYADDTVIACPPVATEYLQAWQDVLATRGLSLNRAKLQVWNPHDLALPLAFITSHPQADITSAGFKVWGLPLDQADATDPRPHVYRAVP